MRALLQSGEDVSLLIAQLPKPARDSYNAWLDALKPLAQLRGRALTAELAKVAARLEVPLKTAQNKMSAYRKQGKVALIDRRLAGPALWQAQEEPEIPQAEQRLFRAYCLNNRESTRRAAVQFRRDWRAGKFSSDAEVNPVTGYPRGYSVRNLTRYAPSQYELKAVRIGMTAAATRGPMTFTTRAGLWVGSHYFFDDVWLDAFAVRVGANAAAGRPLQLGCQDAFSASRFRSGTKLRTKNEQGVNEGLKKANMQLLLAAVLYGHGYSERGTTLMAEHGTAAIDEASEQLLSDETGGLIRVRRSGIIGEEQAVLGSWKGERAGNPRFKSPLESLHRLIHAEMGALPGGTGRNVAHRPETLGAQLDFCEHTLELMKRLPQELAERLLLPLLDYHAEFLPLVEAVERVVDERTDHDLEGWHECRHITSEYRLQPGTHDWMSREQYLALPTPMRNALAQMVQGAPGLYDRTRKLSPREVWQRGATELRRIEPHVVCQLLSEHFTRPEEKVDGAYFVFQDQEIAPGKLMYEARIWTPEDRWQELRDGERYDVIVNPFASDALFVMDGKQSYLGVAPRVQKLSRADEQGLPAIWGHNAQRQAARLERVRADLEPQTQAAREIRENNARLEAAAPRHAAAEERKKVAAAKADPRVRSMEDFLPAGAARSNPTQSPAGAVDDDVI